MSDSFAEMMKDEIEKLAPLEQLAKEFVMTNAPAQFIQRAATVEEGGHMVLCLFAEASIPRARR